MTKKCVCINILLLVFFIPLWGFAGNPPTIGMYGIPTVKNDQHTALASQLLKNNVSSVFVPPNQETIQFFKEQGLQVYLTLNVFGGKQPWKEFSGSVPVLADGTKLSGKYGGICPTHFEWRESRLQLLEKWLQTFSGDKGISGVWLDFIRYPGSWEHAHSEIPDTCYCDRCLTLFQVEKGVDLPKGLGTEDSVRWIHEFAESKWVQWKKEQITSFVRDARSIIENNRTKESNVKLGVFLVPWMQGEREGAVSFILAQDAELFSGYVDVFSPMVYHRMVGRTPGWITEITQYFSEMTGELVWPIIQAEELDAAEFQKAVQAVTQGDGDGLLVYSYSKMDGAFWPLLADFSLQGNLLPESDSYAELEIPVCTPGKEYLFSGEFYRMNQVDRTYPELEIWGKTFLLNSHRVSGKFQNIRLHLRCSDDMEGAPGVFRFINKYPGQPFRMRSPKLIEKLSVKKEPHSAIDTTFFPIGAYGGSPDNIAEFKDLGLNSSLLGFSKRALDKCVQLGMHCTFSLPRDAEKIKILLDSIGPLPESGSFSFYVNDEPGIHSFPRWKAKDIERLLQNRYPDIPTMMAVVRPQVIPDYEEAADFFMLDQYPVPSMPMSWLADSMDIAADSVGRDRLQSIIQAFGGEKWAKYGWPRLPSFEEMNNLAFLSLVHGSRGIYFYKYQAAMEKEQGKEALTKLVGRLQKLLPWLQSRNNFVQVAVEMTSANRVDPQGNPAVHCAEKIKGHKRMLMCVNSLRTYVSANVDMEGSKGRSLRDFYSGKEIVAEQTFQRLDFLPLEVKVFVQ